MKPTFTETVNDASQTRIIGAAEPVEATDNKPKARKPLAAAPEEVTHADPT